MKRCPKCDKTKHANKFGKDKNRKDGRNVYCKQCNREAGNERYRNLTPEKKDRRKYFHDRRRERLRPAWMKIIEEKFGQLECSRCGFNESFSALDFHHEDPSSKEFYIGHLFDMVPNEERIAELDKCTLLCSNCHRILHRDSSLFASHSCGCLNPRKL